MATYTRANAWNNGGTIANTDLLWYAKGVAVMQARALDDPSLVVLRRHTRRIRGYQRVPRVGSLPVPPSVPATPQPSVSVWILLGLVSAPKLYFPPWHRGYLLALEAHIRAAVISEGGPATWALPYWDYFGPGNQFNIPPAFTEQRLPDGSPNPLSVTARFGPDGDGNVFIPTLAAVQQHPNDPNFVYGLVTQRCMSSDLYTGTDFRTPPPGFGGPLTGFSHDGGTSGNLESNPHNIVHVYIGGSAPNGQTYGLMSDPGLAGLDRIFYLHHANIDRMWALWNTRTPIRRTPPG